MQVCANSSRARCAIHLSDTAIRIYSVPQFNFKKRFVKISSWDKVMGLAEYFCRPFQFWFFVQYGHILYKTLFSGPRRRPGRQAHGSTGLAPRHHVWCPWDFLGLINTPRARLVQNNERHSVFSLAVTQAFLEVSDLRGHLFLYTFSRLNEGSWTMNEAYCTYV
jgi:hypothetical protein